MLKNMTELNFQRLFRALIDPERNLTKAEKTLAEYVAYEINPMPENRPKGMAVGR